jgi:tetratricopeptide (TPR) repeat protein
LLDLFQRVEFHPLSLRLLSQQLKTRLAVDITIRLNDLLLADTGDDKSLRASLKLSLDKLPPEVRDKWLPRLGVFHGGAMEDSLLVVTGLGKVEEDSEITEAYRSFAAFDSGEWSQERVDGIKAILSEETLAEFRRHVAEHAAESAFAPGVDETTWPHLKSALQAAALIEVEDLSPVGVDVPFLKFHPTLAPVLRAQLSPEECDALSAAHRRRYYAVSCDLYSEDGTRQHQARGKARRELPNLLHAVRGALEAGDDTAVEFASNVCRFLGSFGLHRDAADLNERATRLHHDVGSQSWLLAQSNRGEQLLASGNTREALAVFMAILQRLGDAPTYERCNTLIYIGQCLKSQGRADLAAQRYHEALEVVDKLEQSDSVRKLRAAIQFEIGNLLTHLGQLAGARAAHESGLQLVQGLGDLRSVSASNAQLGALALQQGDLQEAERRYGEALNISQQLNEPASAAGIWHQLGVVAMVSRQWDEAERCYRKSAEIKVDLGMIVGSNGATASWINLALLCQLAGKSQAAEAWNRKAMEALRQGGDRAGLSKTLSNLALLLQDQPDHLAEARQLAEESLSVDKTLEPNVAQIWHTYHVLAEIAGKQNDAAQAGEYRRLAREAYRNFPGSKYHLQQMAPSIEAVIAAVARPQLRAQWESQLAGLAEAGGANLAAAIHCIWDGERDLEALYAFLGGPESLIVETILVKLAKQEKPRRGWWPFRR